MGFPLCLGGASGDSTTTNQGTAVTLANQVTAITLTNRVTAIKLTNQRAAIESTKWVTAVSMKGKALQWGLQSDDRNFIWLVVQRM